MNQEAAMRSKSSFILSSGLLMFVLAVAIAPALRAKDEKLKPEQVIAKHLESIGSAAKLKEIKNRTTNGATHVDFRVGGHASLDGQGNIVSDANSVRASFNYPALEYPGEQFAFDGERVGVGQVNPGNRSPLGRFIYENEVLLKEGLLFGSLSTSWALLNTAVKQPKLDLSGPKKVGGRSLYEMKYEAKKGRGNVQAWLYFDPDTFRHVRSQYKVEVTSSQIAKIADSAELERYTLIEEFDQFKEVDGLTLPHSYKLEFTIDSPRGAFVGNWTYAVKQIAHNQPIDRQLFSVK
jgi:hypothetical protein